MALPVSDASGARVRERQVLTHRRRGATRSDRREPGALAACVLRVLHLEPRKAVEGVLLPREVLEAIIVTRRRGRLAL